MPDLKDVTDLESSGAPRAKSRAGRDREASVVEADVVEVGIQHVAVARITTHKGICPGVIRMVEDVEELEAQIKAMSFEGHADRFREAGVRAVGPVRPQRVAAGDVSPHRRIDQVTGVRQLDRIAIRVAISG